jgi:hypothetical protein
MAGSAGSAPALVHDLSSATGGSMSRRPWFKPVGLFYMPVSWPGVVCTAATVAFCVQAFMAVDRHSHSASDTLFGIFPYVVPAFLLLNWLASRKCEAPSHDLAG